MLNKIAHSGLVALALALTACASTPVVGSWENADSSSSYEDTLTIEDDGVGTRSVEDTQIIDGITYKLLIDWTIGWEEKGEGEYEAELECDSAKVKANGETLLSGCQQVMDQMGVNFDFDVECTLSAAEDELECELESGDEVTFEKLAE